MTIVAADVVKKSKCCLRIIDNFAACCYCGAVAPLNEAFTGRMYDNMLFAYGE
jgi:hypothetical protein